MKELLEEIERLVARGEGGALACIVSARGSLPMSRRSRMLILSDGTQRGTVGGGCLEAEVHALGRESLRSGRPHLVRFTLTEERAGAEGLNCGGTVEILVEPVGSGSDRADLDLLGRARAEIDAGRETVLATAIAGAPGEAAPCRIRGRALIGWKGLLAGWGALSPEEPEARSVSEEALAILGQDRSLVLEPPGEGGSVSTCVFLETLSQPPTLYLFGGGHVSLAVSRVARVAGFRVVVVDDRPAFANAERFPEAARTLVLPMERALEHLPIDRNSYIVAVTRGHQHDEPIVEQAVRTDAAYIGMIGSRRKVAIMWKRMRERGVTDSQLARVRAPIGLPIGGDGPGEIAVSIVAQMVQVRRAGAGATVTTEVPAPDGETRYRR